MNMNTPIEPDPLTHPFGEKEKKSFFTSGTIVFVVVAVFSFVVFCFYGKNDSATLSESKPELQDQQSDDEKEKAKQKELIAYLQQHPDDEFAHFQLGQLIQNRAPFQALENFSRVTPRHPRYFEAVDAIAEIALAQDLPNRAKSALITLVREFPKESRYFEELARLLFKEGDTDKALGYANRSIELGATQAQDYLLVADILKQAGRVNEMSAPLKQALYLDPESYRAHLDLAYAALYSGDLSTAERETRWCLQHQPESVVPLRYLASINRNRGKIDAALSNVEQALLINPHDYESLLLKADLLMFQKNGQEAYDLLKPLYSKRETDRRYLSALARAAGSIGKREEALELQRKNQQLIKTDDLRPSSLQSETVEGTQYRSP